jgi:hypothetical protein
MSPGMRREIIALPEHMGMRGYLLELVFISVALQIHLDGTTKGSRGPHGSGQAFEHFLIAGLVYVDLFGVQGPDGNRRIEFWTSKDSFNIDAAGVPGGIDVRKRRRNRGSSAASCLIFRSSKSTTSGVDKSCDQIPLSRTPGNCTILRALTIWFEIRIPLIPARENLRLSQCLARHPNRPRLDLLVRDEGGLVGLPCGRRSAPIPW